GLRLRSRRLFITCVTLGEKPTIHTRVRLPLASIPSARHIPEPMAVSRLVFAIGLKAVLNGTLRREASRGRNPDAVLDELDSAARRSRTTLRPRHRLVWGKPGHAGTGETLRDCPRKLRPISRFSESLLGGR